MTIIDLMYKVAQAKFDLAQKGFVDPKIIIGGLVVLVIIFFVASGSLKFSASIKPNGNEQQAAESTPTSAPSKAKTYQNEANGISLEYPANWSLKENPTEGYIAALFSPKDGNDDDYIESLGIKAVDISAKPSVTLQEIADLWENQTKGAEPSLVVIDRKATTIVGEDAKEIIYNFKDNKGNGEGKGMTKITLKNKTAYIFQYSAAEKDYAKYLPDIESILSSVKF